jgi:hypothetical protein
MGRCLVWVHVIGGGGGGRSTIGIGGMLWWVDVVIGNYELR